jgi:hypothetical protein
MGNGLWRERPSDTDVRYNPDASDNLINQSPIWTTYDGYWGPYTFTYITDTNIGGGTFRQPELYNVTSGSGWPYKRDVFSGYSRIIVAGSRLSLQGWVFYPPAPADFCAKDVPLGMANVVGNNNKDPTNTTAVCGVNGNVMNDERFAVSSYERNGEAIAFWSAVGPILYNHGGRYPPGTVSSFYKPVGNDSLFSNVMFNIPGFPRTMANIETFLNGGSLPSSFGSTTSAAGLPVEEGGSGIEYNSLIYSSQKMNDEQEFRQQLLQAYKDFNITQDEIPEWLTEGEAFPSCLAETYGGCPTEEDYCGPQGIDPSCTESPYQNPPASMKPGAIAGFTILAIVVVAIMGYVFHRQSVKRQNKRLRKQFAQQVAKRVDLRGSVSQLNPTDLLAEFKRIDQIQGGSSDGFISREELWQFVSSGKAGEMSEKDFTLLFDSMDIKGRGKVNFVEFCAFMSSCGEEVHELAMEKEENEGYSREEKLYAASRRLSSRKIQEDDLPAKNSEKKEIGAVKWMHGKTAKAEVIDV